MKTEAEIQVLKNKFKIKYIRDTITDTTIIVNDSVYVDDLTILALLEQEIENPYIQDIIKEYLKKSKNTFGTIKFSDSSYNDIKVNVSVGFPVGKREIIYNRIFPKTENMYKYVGLCGIDGTIGVSSGIYYAPLKTNLGLVAWQKDKSTKIGWILQFKF